MSTAWLRLDWPKAVADGDDSAPLDPNLCRDLDGDTCDDCALVQPPDPANDGADADSNGICDATDADDDGDGYADADETTNCSPPSDPLDPIISADMAKAKGTVIPT